MRGQPVQTRLRLILEEGARTGTLFVEVVLDFSQVAAGARGDIHRSMRRSGQADFLLDRAVRRAAVSVRKRAHHAASTRSNGPLSPSAMSFSNSAWAASISAA